MRFDASVLDAAARRFIELIVARNGAAVARDLWVDHKDCRWSYEDSNEFLAEYRRNTGNAFICIGANIPKAELLISVSARQVFVSVELMSRAEIESVFEVMERAVSHSRLSPQVAHEGKQPIVFIGHGRSSAWKDLKDHLQDKHEFKIEAYETGARAGHTIRDILEDMAKKSTFALLVLTAEDEQIDRTLRARENVVHECGLLQGKLGFSRAIMLMEEGVEPFSNVAGIQFIRFSKGNIKEVFGEVLATLKREFG